MPRLRAIDMFCGVGGSSWGARLAGIEIVAAFDIWELAQRVYCTNFGDVKFYAGRIEGISANCVAECVGRIDVLIASPECTNHGPARGNRQRSERSRETALQVARFAKVFRPRWVVVENVQGMRSWPRYPEFRHRLEHIGYSVREVVINAAEHGVPQSRRRLFLLCDLAAAPECDFDTMIRPKRTAMDVVDRNGAFAYSPLFSKKRAPATIERAERAISSVGRNEPFLLVYYGSDHSGGWQSLEVPLRTLTTLDRFAFVKPTRRGHVMRMLQVPELKKAMGMPIRFRIDDGTRRDRIKLVGNAVCPPVMRDVLRKLTADS